MMNPHQQQADSLSPERLQLFVAGLSGLSSDEVGKAKALYLRNAISEYRAMKEGVEGFAVVQGCFMLIPIFWPILWAQKKGIKAAMRLSRERITNAIHVWRDDLDEHEFESLLAEVDRE